MGYILDTCFLIDFVRGEAMAVAKAKEIKATGASKFIATPVLFELLSGLLDRRSRTETNRFRRALSPFIVLAFDEHAARDAAQIKPNSCVWGEKATTRT